MIGCAGSPQPIHDGHAILAGMTDLDALRHWLDNYTKAWRSNDADTIGALFTEDAVYRWNPWEVEPDGQGRDAIVRAWLDDQDAPDAWELSCEPLAVNGDLGVARCVTTYAPTEDEPETTYHNIFLVRLADDGRCSDFTEYYMKQPQDDDEAEEPELAEEADEVVEAEER
jgi:ketosteroid isomerase-like protein